ncbi:MAG: hypothetical protein K2X87_35070 [Gemmataceae bacterium]|nr:hypothetical protein [Gemmataceae bacterium]
MAAPDTLLIPYEDSDSGRFTHVGRYDGGNQFPGYVAYAPPKFYHTEEITLDGQVIYREHTNCFAVLHRFDATGRHLASDIERVAGTRTSGEQDWAKLDGMIAGLGPTEFCDIRVKPFRLEVDGVAHGLIYECVDAEDPDDPAATDEYVMLEPNDIMFHPPWDSGEYST